MIIWCMYSSGILYDYLYFVLFQWKTINELNKLARLEQLKIVRNPLMDQETPETVRQLIVAKVKHLKKCNRTVVGILIYV